MRGRGVAFAALSWMLVCVAARAAAPAGDVAGIVVDADSGAPVEGAVVRLDGAGAAADAEGRFLLHGVPAGAATLEVTRVGYAPRRVAVVVVDGQVTRPLIELHAQAIPLQRTLVESDVEATSAASARPVREFDLRTRPAATPRALLQVVPGLATVGQGGGRAEQILLRGFDNGFGTDVAIDVDGVPANLVSHGHGQGYADVHFLIPAIVEGVEVYKGPYFPESGNLANAARIELSTATHLHANRVEVRTGSFGARGGTILYQLPTAAARTNAWFAGDLARTDGPYDPPQGLRRLTLFARFHHRVTETSTLDASLSGYAASWLEPGLVAGRAVARGDVSRFGSLDDTQGGSTSRQSAALTYRTRDADAGRELETTAYAVSYGAQLYSDVTFYTLDPIYGDMVEQADHRTIVGLHSRYRFGHRLGPWLATGGAGGGLRADDISLDTWQVVARRRYWPLLDASVRERQYFLWGREEIVLAPRLRLVLGLRYDAFAFDLDDRLEAGIDWILPLADWLVQLRRPGKPLHVPIVQPHASGVAAATVTSPKVNLVYSPWRDLDLFADFGTGFHSNDARAVVLGQFVRDQSRVLAGRGATPEEIDGVFSLLKFDSRQRDVSALPRTVGAELGARLRVERPGAPVPRAPLHQLAGGLGHYPSAGGGVPTLPVRLSDRANVGAALWWIDVDEEYVFDTELARPERLGATRRWGVDLEIRAQLRDGLWVDTDVNLARGRLRAEPDGADRIPLAPRLTTAGGLTARRRDGVEASLRWRHVGDRPATPEGDLTARGFVLVDATGALERGRWRAQLSVANLLDERWREAQVPLQTILPGEGALHIRGPLPDPEIHFTAGAPRQVEAALALRFD